MSHSVKKGATPSSTRKSSLQRGSTKPKDKDGKYEGLNIKREYNQSVRISSKPQDMDA